MLTQAEITGKTPAGSSLPHTRMRNTAAAAFVLLGIVLARPVWVEADVTGSYLYSLSDFSGTIPFYTATLFADQNRHEIYVTSSDNVVRIFNNKGMEIYRFNDDGSAGIILDTVVDADGSILALTTSTKPGTYSLVRCNYRGEDGSEVPIKNLPPGFSSEFHPYTLAYRPGHVYLVDKASLKAIIVDGQGNVEQAIDFLSVLKQEEKKRYDFEIGGFTVDREGNIFFTVPVLFKAFRLAPDGQLTAFGERGGAPGKFNIAAAIAVDDKGYCYVADKLKCAILIFDRDFVFRTQIGYRGWNKEGLIAPTDLAVLDDKLYVAQMGRRGVSVFDIRH